MTSYLPTTDRLLPGGERIAVVYGTRPEIIKLAPVIAEFRTPPLLIHTGQHYDANMSSDVAEAAGVPAPDVVLRRIGGMARHRQIGMMVDLLGEGFSRAKPRVVLVQGDTNTVSAGAQAANYCGIPVVHVEAGLRSRDRGMPEEINRIVAGVLADVHCAATLENVAHLLAEGVPRDRVVLTGNTIVEVTQRTLATPGAPVHPEIPDGFVLATIHRPENTDDPERLAEILRALGGLDAPTVFVIHPRTRALAAQAGLRYLLDRLVLLDPVVHREFLQLAQHARLLISDSGGLQEECTVLKKRLLVIRRSTERPESIGAGFATLVTPGEDIAAAANAALRDRDADRRLSSRPSPYGDGRAARRIAEIAQRICDGDTPEEACGHGQERVRHHPQ